MTNKYTHMKKYILVASVLVASCGEPAKPVSTTPVITPGDDSSMILPALIDSTDSVKKPIDTLEAQ
jgi:hypothetical protein